MIKANWHHGVLGRITDTTVIEAGLYSAAGDDQGPILWPPDTSGRQYQGRCEDVVEGITQDLQDLIEASRKKCNSEEVLR